MKKYLILTLVFILFSCNDDDNDDTVDTCLNATNIQVNTITSNSATLTWNDPNEAGSYIIEYGPSGFVLGSGTTLESTTTSVNLINLDEITAYDVYVQVVCSTNNTSVFSDAINFTTSLIACLDTTNVQVNSITSNSATLTWNESSEADSYIIEYGISGFVLGTGTTQMSSVASLDLTGLEAITTYDVYVRAVCSANSSSMFSDAVSFTTETLPVIPELRPTLSEINLFIGDLSDLNITPRAFNYELNTQLFTDYAHKQRIIALPEGTSMTYDDDGLPIFPDNTVIAKTFFYNTDERDLTLGRTIIETRLLIKEGGQWTTGDYVWNETQTEATLDLNGSTLPISWIDADGETNDINYEIPSNNDCFTCHASFNENKPIGPKLRSMNFDINGVNQLEQFINNGYLTGITTASSIGVLPNWEDLSVPLEDRARAYIDMNCAHCHIEGGSCFDQSTLNLAYETSLEESLIDEQSPSIELRITTNIDGISMPFIGTTILHDEGVQLILDYIESLDE